MLSFSNFGSVRASRGGEDGATRSQLLRAARSVARRRRRDAGRHGARSARSCSRDYPFSALKEQANVLIFPNLSAGNIAYKLLNHLGGATAIGPILVGMRRPVHVLERGADVQDIVNMAAVAVVDAQERVIPAGRRRARARERRPLRRFSRGYDHGDSDDSRSDDAGAAGQGRASTRRGSRPSGDVHWNLVAPELIQHADAPRRRPARRHGPVRRRHRAAHRPLAERQVRRARIRRRRRTSTGARSISRFTERAVRHAARRRARLPERAATSCSCRISTAAPIPKYRLSVRYVSPNAWHMAFVRNMFIRPEATELPTLRRRTSRCCTRRSSRPIRRKHGTRTGTFIVLNLAKRMILIGGTRYAGELKKSMFTVMNYYMPKQGVLSMHCSANIGAAGDTALFFGLSGTGKTTLSADPHALAHRRRRARLVARRRLQLRRRLLREGRSTSRPRASRTSIAPRRCSARSSRTSCSIR